VLTGAFVRHGQFQVLVHNIFALVGGYQRNLVAHFKGVVSLLQVFPEAEPGRTLELGHVMRCHPKGKDVQTEIFLAMG